jgi:protein-disulfide isomerase
MADDLRSAPVPPVRRDDHVRGALEDPLVVVYGDFTCPACAKVHARLAILPVRRIFRHFALKAKHPRAPALAAAAEAAALQGAFWPFHDALYADQGRLDDPHLWARVTELGLDLERFDRDRRAPAVQARIQRDVRDGLRAGVALTPTFVVDGDVVPAARTSAILDAFGS